MDSQSGRNQTQEVKDLLETFVQEMRPLDAEFAKVLNDNLWNLYIESGNNESGNNESGNNENLTAIDQFFSEDEIEDYLVTLAEWNDMQSYSAYIPDDGDAYYSTNLCYSNVSAFRNTPPAWATHVILFGK